MPLRTRPLLAYAAQWMAAKSRDVVRPRVQMHVDVDERLQSEHARSPYIKNEQTLRIKRRFGRSARFRPDDLSSRLHLLGASVLHHSGPVVTKETKEAPIGVSFVAPNRQESARPLTLGCTHTLYACLGAYAE